MTAISPDVNSKFKPEFIQPGLLSKILINPWFWVLFILFVFSYPIYRSLNRILPDDLPIINQIPEYRMIDENGSSFGSTDLTGKVYLANFMFTRCPTVCPKMLKSFEKIQKRIRSTGHKVQIVTFSVDPLYDQPQVLFKKAREHHANPHVWHFLTSNNEQDLFKLYQDGFKVPVAKAENLMEFAHSEKIVLVDQLNRIRGYYAMDENSINKLMIDVGLLINRPLRKE
jgi:protein SCO1/2